MFNKSRLTTVALGIVASAVVIGMVRKSAQTAIKSGTKPEETLAGKLGIL